MLMTSRPAAPLSHAFCGSFANSDHWARVVFPIVFAIYIGSAVSEAGIGQHYDSLATSACYRQAMGMAKA